MKIKNILICGLVLLGMVGCDDFESVNTNPDSTNKVTSAMLATELLRDITTYKMGMERILSGMNCSLSICRGQRLMI